MKTYPFYRFSVGDIVCYSGGTVWQVIGYDYMGLHTMYILRALKVGSDHDGVVMVGQVSSAVSYMIDQMYETVEFVSVNENI